MTRFYSPRRGRSAHLTTRTHYTVVNFSKQMHRTQELHLALVGKLICIVGSTFCLKGWSVFCFTLCWVLYHDKTKPATPFWLDDPKRPAGQLLKSKWRVFLHTFITCSLTTNLIAGVHLVAVNFAFSFHSCYKTTTPQITMIIVTDVSSFNQIGAAFS